MQFLRTQVAPRPRLLCAEGARAFDDLSLVLKQAVEVGVSKERVQGLQEVLKAGKLYLKGDFKVIFFFCPMRVYCNQSQNWGKIGEKIYAPG